MLPLLTAGERAGLGDGREGDGLRRDTPADGPAWSTVVGPAPMRGVTGADADAEGDAANGLADGARPLAVEKDDRSTLALVDPGVLATAAGAAGVALSGLLLRTGVVLDVARPGLCCRCKWLGVVLRW